MDDEDFSFDFGANFLEVLADVVAVFRVVHHDEEHSLFAELFVFIIALPPFLDAEFQVVRVFLGKHDGLVLAKLRAAGGIRQDGVLDDVLMDGLDERIVGDGLDEDGAVVVLRRGGDVDLEGEFPLTRDHLVVDVLDGLEPCHALVVDVVGLVAEDGGFHGLTLGEVIAEGREGVIRIFDEMLGLEPVSEQGLRGGGCAVVTGCSPSMDFLAEVLLRAVAAISRRRCPARSRPQETSDAPAEEDRKATRGKAGAVPLAR